MNRKTAMKLFGLLGLLMLLSCGYADRPVSYTHLTLPTIA